MRKGSFMSVASPTLILPSASTSPDPIQDIFTQRSYVLFLGKDDLIEASEGNQVVVFGFW
jgi:hypothetical protein